MFEIKKGDKLRIPLNEQDSQIITVEDVVDNGDGTVTIIPGMQRTLSLTHMIRTLCNEHYATEEQLFELLVLAEWERRAESKKPAEQAHDPIVTSPKKQSSGPKCSCREEMHFCYRHGCMGSCEKCQGRDCDEYGKYRIIVRGEEKKVCLRHYNMWEDPEISKKAVFENTDYMDEQTVARDEVFRKVNEHQRETGHTVNVQTMVNGLETSWSFFCVQCKSGGEEFLGQYRRDSTGDRTTDEQPQD